MTFKHGYERYETDKAVIGIPRKWLKDCLDNEMLMINRDLTQRVRRLERKVMLLEKGEYPREWDKKELI